MGEKVFVYDRILEAEDICNLKDEQKKIFDGITTFEKLIVYGRRNSGKTSVVKSIIIPEFEKKHPKHFTLFVDCMEVQDIDSLNARVRAGFEDSFQKSFPVKSFVESVKKYLSSIRPEISIDPVSGEPKLSLTTGSASQMNFVQVMELIRTKISPHLSTLLVFDEFQDIAFVPEAQGLFRNQFQQLTRTPMILMGSKKHLLARMFARPQAPFADFGKDIEFQDIPYENYHRYIIERFQPRGLDIDIQTSRYWQDHLWRCPEPINIVGAHLVSNYQNQMIEEKDIRGAIAAVVEDRRSRFEELVGRLSGLEEHILISIAKFGPISQPTGKDFLKHVRPSHATVKKIFGFLEDHTYIEKSPTGFRLANPLLHFYLQKFR